LVGFGLIWSDSDLLDGRSAPASPFHHFVPFAFPMAARSAPQVTARSARIPHLDGFHHWTITITDRWDCQTIFLGTGLSASSPAFSE
jgi:hypothetical protein